VTNNETSGRETFQYGDIYMSLRRICDCDEGFRNGRGALVVRVQQREKEKFSEYFISFHKDIQVQ
jgi:hypothetical protein